MAERYRSKLEEERRLFYVALTRAEKRANLTFTNNRYRWGKIIESEESRFLDELDASFIKFDYQKYNEVDLSFKKQNSTPIFSFSSTKFDSPAN